MNAESLAHTTWDCKCHVVFIPKWREKAMFGQVKRHLGGVFHELAGHKECRIEEGHLMPDVSGEAAVSRRLHRVVVCRV